MKYILFIFIILGLCSSTLAQSNSNILLGNSWQVTTLNIGGDDFAEGNSTCVYSTIIEFNSETTISLNSTCRNSSIVNYTLWGEFLLLENANNSTDTLLITDINSSSFTTLLIKKAIINDSILSEPINIITSYEKL